MHGVSVYNILSSNIINLVQYLAAILLNKNIEKLKNKALITDIGMVAFTIIFPVILLNRNISLNSSLIPMFLLLYFYFRFLNNNMHRQYLEKEEKVVEEGDGVYESKNVFQTVRYVLVLIVTGFLLFIVSELLGNSLENLCHLFSIPEFIIGTLLGIITSIPELITFFESQRQYKEKENDISGVVEATNNLLTSNTLNLFIIQTVGILLTRA